MGHAYFPFEPFAETEGEFAPYAHTTAEVEFEGVSRRFWLRVAGNFLFFMEDDADLDPIFGLTQPLCSTHQAARALIQAPEILQHIFRREFAAGHWGLSSYRYHVYFGGSAFALFGADGSGTVRPWWDDRAGIPFRYDVKEWDSPAALLNWRRPNRKEMDELPPDEKRDHWRHYMEFVEHFDVPDKDPALIQKFKSRRALARHREPFARPFRWERGSEAEAIPLTRHIWHAARHVWEAHPDMPHLTIQYRSATPRNSADWKCHLEPTRWNHNSHSIIWHGFLGKYHYPVGAIWLHEWEEDADPPRRAWHLAHYENEWIVERPTAHDALEATLALRDWLRGKVSDEDAQKILKIADDPAAWSENNFYSEIYSSYLQ